MDFMTWLRQKLKSDRGAATLTMLVVAMPLICLCVGFALDVAKSVYVKQSLNSMAQSATQSGVQVVAPNGSMNEASVQRVVNEYRAQLGGRETEKITCVKNAAGVYSDSRCFDNRALGTAATRQLSVFKGTGTCATSDITLNDGTPVGVKTLPYMVIKLDTGRQKDNSNSAVTYVSEAGAPASPQAGAQALDPTKKYKVVSAEIHDAVPNIMMGMFGMPCQRIISTESAIAFGSNEDTP